jgi:hypothetical protein
MQPFESFRTKRPARIRRGGRRSSSSSPILINYHGPFTLSCPAFCVFFGLRAPVLKLYDRIAPRIGIAQRPPRPGFVYRYLRPLGGRAAKPGAHPRWFFHSHTHARYPGTHLRARVVTRVPKAPKIRFSPSGRCLGPESAKMSGMSLLPWAGVDINALLRPLPHTPIWRDTEKRR